MSAPRQLLCVVRRRRRTAPECEPHVGSYEGSVEGMDGLTCDDWKRERGCFPRPSLRTCHEIAAFDADRNSISLDRRGILELAPAYILDQRRAKKLFGLIKRCYFLGRVFSSDLYGNVLVGVKIDSWQKKYDDAVEAIQMKPVATRSLCYTVQPESYLYFPPQTPLALSVLHRQTDYLHD